jgi:hypothetical protein
MTLVERLKDQLNQAIRNDELEQLAIDTLVEQAQRIEELEKELFIANNVLASYRANFAYSMK